MDKNLKKYRNTLKKRTAACIAFGLAAAALSIIDYYKLFGHDRIESIAMYFRGALILIGVCAMFIIINYVKAFDAEGTLKRLYEEENDPRTKRANAAAGFPMILYTSAVMAAAGVVFAYFNHTIFFALMIAAVVQLLVAVAVRYIYLNVLPQDNDDE